jgi:tetratricopeptide (TPR) repeat protein
MRTTASYDLFPDAPGERALAKARYLAREGKVDDALSEYRGVITGQPEVKASWTEAFELLRRNRRSGEALALADEASLQFPKDAFPLALKGAALIEMGRYKDALASLEVAVNLDPDLALIWHELGNASYLLGDRTRALMALDRAFALEPHSATLRLRGRVLRDAGRYQAAEVAFEGAAEAAEHDEQREEAEREIGVTRRYALHAPRRPDKLTDAERWFAETGGVVLASASARSTPDDASLVDGLVLLARDRRWHLGQLVVLGGGGPNHVWKDLGDKLGVTVTGADRLDLDRIPLAVAARPSPGMPEWDGPVHDIRAGARGLIFTLETDTESRLADVPDVAGALRHEGRRLALACDPAQALAQAQHPSARVAGRRLA